jgi:hypothetical protein
LPINQKKSHYEGQSAYSGHPSTVLTQVQTKINEAAALFAPYLIALTPTERHKLPKMGEKTTAFVKKAHDFVRQNPALVPSYT